MDMLMVMVVIADMVVGNARLMPKLRQILITDMAATAKLSPAR